MSTSVTLIKARLAGLYKEIGFLKEQLKKEMDKEANMKEVPEVTQSPAIVESPEEPARNPQWKQKWWAQETLSPELPSLNKTLEKETVVEKTVALNPNTPPVVRQITLRKAEMSYSEYAGRKRILNVNSKI